MAILLPTSQAANLRFLARQAYEFSCRLLVCLTSKCVMLVLVSRDYVAFLL